MKKNIKSLVCNLVQLICPILMLIFLSQAYVTLIGRTIWSGYSFISFDTESVMTIYSIATVLTCIFAGLLIILTIISVLRDLKMIKTARYDILLRKAKLIVNILLTITLLTALVCIGIKVSDVNIGMHIGWAVITNLVLGCVSMLAYLISRMKLVK